MNKQVEFDHLVRPLVLHIENICRGMGIPFFAAFQMADPAILSNGESKTMLAYSCNVPEDSCLQMKIYGEAYENVKTEFEAMESAGVRIVALPERNDLSAAK